MGSSETPESAVSLSLLPGTGAGALPLTGRDGGAGGRWSGWTRLPVLLSGVHSGCPPCEPASLPGAC